MHDILIKASHALIQVVIVGIVLGAGLPAVYSLGMRALMIGHARNEKGEPVGNATLAGKALAAICFGVVLAAICYGILIIIFGKAVLPR